MSAAAAAVAIPVALSATSRLPGGTRPQRPRLSYTITVNGQAQEYSGPEPVPRYVISPGEELSGAVDVTVPEGTTVTVLWLGRRASRQLTVQWGWLGLRSPGTGQRIIAALEVPDSPGT
jgi:hypothetical protein